MRSERKSLTSPQQIDRDGLVKSRKGTKQVLVAWRGNKTLLTCYHRKPTSVTNGNQAQCWRDIKGPLTDLFEPLLRKNYFQITSSFHLLQSYFKFLTFLMISNTSSDHAHGHVTNPEKMLLLVSTKNRDLWPGDKQKSVIHGLPVTLRMLRVKSDKSDWFWS